MGKQIIVVKDASGTTKNMQYDDRDVANGYMARVIVPQIEEIIPGVGVTDLGKAEDTVATSGDTGVAIWGVRRDTPVSNVSAAGDYAEIPVSGFGALWTSPVPSPTASGVSLTKIIAAAGINSTLIKSSLGQLYGAVLCNLSASVKFVKFYNKATAPTVGADIPVMTVLIPSGQTILLDSDGLGINAFSLGIGMSITGAYADADTTATAIGDVIANIMYK